MDGLLVQRWVKCATDFIVRWQDALFYTCCWHVTIIDNRVRVMDTQKVPGSSSMVQCFALERRDYGIQITTATAYYPLSCSIA
eukprot:scaffold15580_cov448-Alexandrium_tamarense.AAC.2